MKVVISCSNKKNGESLIFNSNEILFVANPQKTERINNKIYYHPDEKINNTNKTWREYVIENQSAFLKAYELYFNDIYRKLYSSFGSDLFILSAGWGIVNSEFNLPKYDITFSKQAEEYKRRTKKIYFNDFNHLKNISPNEDIVAFIGIDYIGLFYELTKDLTNKKIIFYNSKKLSEIKKAVKQNETYHFKKYQTNIRTNWHYVAAKDFLNGKLDYE
jgi:hypothetical protein